MTAGKIFRKHFARNRLVAIYNKRIRHSGAIGLDRTRPAALASTLREEVALILRKVHDGRYHFTAYKEKLISKGAASLPRQISVPTARDRIVLRALCDCLSEIYPTAKISLPQVVIDSLKNALLSNTYSAYAKIDLKNFYPSLPHSQMKSVIWKKVRKKEFRHLIESAITTPTVPESLGGKGASSTKIGVPQGLAISNVLAEISLNDIDVNYSNRSGIWYKRYVDDILILANRDNIETIATELIRDLKNIGLNPHDFGQDSKSKIADITEAFTFLGYSVEGESLLIPQKSILRFESSIAKIFTAYRHKLATARSPADKERALAYCAWKINLRITGCYFEGKRLGWVSYYSQITSTSQLRSVNHTIQKLTHRFVPSGEIKPKSLIKTFYELRRGADGKHAYIVNLDTCTLATKRNLLAMWIGNKAFSLSPERVERMFLTRVAKAVSELEEDIAQAS
ncbi:RNA-directed DNA polymerase [Pseudomonas oryzihabitans]|uniref:Reverse transcriptase n=1 Tax=Pseudomonas oryzihabitans TaxID=47885 RepID=A0ABX3IVQ2_9PSED|nr:RNA-directed DNA polymerase [Pseudomonas psychrotolerans]ONN72459.1 reverse transcriptase [Pseudomonas psychrotolerans]